jgi:two-component system sensor histidine kinase HydH
MHPSDSADKSLRNALEDAQRLLRNAQEDAARILKNAQEDAARILKNAQEDAARILKNAQEDASRLLKYAQEDAEKLSRAAGPEEKPRPEDGPNKVGIGNTAIKNDKMRTVGEMSSRLAHDLQNPLAIIKNTLEILKLKQPKLDEKTKENYERIERAATKMSQLVRDVLDYVRTSNLLVERTSLTRLLKTVIADIEVPEDIKVILPAEEVSVYGDIKQLEIVFSNLLLNSIQAIKEKGKIMVQASDTDDMIVIDVIDNGQGIAKETLPRIFEPLFTTKQNGTGLGLASCKSIVESHGGTIECSSIVGKGTVFTIKLPKI